MREHRAAAAVVLLLVLALQCFDLRAELLFRSVEQINGQQRWSPIRKYSNSSDTAYTRVSASGAAVPATRPGDKLICSHLAPQVVGAQGRARKISRLA